MKSIIKHLALLNALVGGPYDMASVGDVPYSQSVSHRRSTSGDYRLKKMAYDNQLTVHSSWYKKFKRLQSLKQRKGK